MLPREALWVTRQHLPQAQVRAFLCIFPLGLPGAQPLPSLLLQPLGKEAVLAILGSLNGLQEGPPQVYRRQKLKHPGQCTDEMRTTNLPQVRE